MKPAIGCLIVFVAAAALLSVKIAAPSGYVFDEVIYPQAAVNLLQGSNIEDSHPPLGKLVMAASIHLLGDNRTGWRAPSVIAGAALLALIFLFTHLLAGMRAAIIATVLTAANCLWLVMSRIGCLDAMATVLVFGGISVTTAVLYEKLSPRWLALCGLLLGLAMCVKWLALAPLGVCAALIWYFNRKAVAHLIAMGAAFLVGYLAPFLVLARLIHQKLTMAWLWQQQLLIPHGHVGQLGPINQISHWWTWPFKIRAQALYIVGDQHILLLGNPLVMWLGAAVVVGVGLWMLVGKKHDKPLIILAAFYAALYGQYALMPLKTEFYHYYFAAALCLGPLLAIALPRKLALAVAVAAVLMFAAVLPSLIAVPRGQWGESRAWLIPPYLPPERLELVNVTVRNHGASGVWYTIRRCGEALPEECAARLGREEGEEIPRPAVANSGSERWLQYTWVCRDCSKAKIDRIQVWDGVNRDLAQAPSALVFEFPRQLAMNTNDLLQLSYNLPGEN